MMSPLYRIAICASFCWLLMYPAGAASNAELPKPFSQALVIYKQQGIRAFVNAMVAGGPLEGKQELRLQVSVLEKIEDYYGNYQSIDIVEIITLSASTRLVYFILNYEKGPVFGSLTAYQGAGSESITAFDFHTKADKAFPPALMSRQ